MRQIRGPLLEEEIPDDRVGDRDREATSRSSDALIPQLREVYECILLSGCVSISREEDISFYVVLDGAGLEHMPAVHTVEGVSIRHNQASKGTDVDVVELAPLAFPVHIAGAVIVELVIEQINLPFWSRVVTRLKPIGIVVNLAVAHREHPITGG